MNLRKRGNLLLNNLMVLHEVLSVRRFGFEHARAGADELSEVDGLDLL